MPLLSTPFTCILVGPSCSGKTVLLKKLIDRNKFAHSKLILFYQTWQTIYEEFPPKTEFFRFWLEKTNSEKSHEGGEVFELENLIKNVTNNGHLENVTLIFDDGLSLATKTYVMHEVFSRISHHYRINVFLIIQSLFEPNLRTIVRNCNYLFLFKCVRDASQVRHIAFQMHPNKRLAHKMIEAFEEATKTPFSALLIDFKPDTLNYLRLKTDYLNIGDDSFSFYCIDDKCIPRSTDDKEYINETSR